jgi:hypothetical protein
VDGLDDLHSGYVFFYGLRGSASDWKTGNVRYDLTAVEACELQRSCGNADGLFDDIFLAILPIGRPTSAAFSRLSVSGGLAAHEGVLGGHTLARHVNIGSLAQRLGDEPLLAAASRFASREIAEASIGTALDVNQALIRNWLRGSSGSLALTHRFAGPIGEILVRGAASSARASTVTVILRRYPGFPEGFRIHTAFPGL